MKGPSSNDQHDGAALRIAIVHARWNKQIVDALVAGAVAKLTERGVTRENVVIESVPGSFELPLACAKFVFHAHGSSSDSLAYRVISGSHIQTGGTATDLLGGMFAPPTLKPQSRTATPAPTSSALHQPFDAVIAIGVLIKGATMHFEYISETVSHALMRVQLDSGVPVIFGVLTALTEDQALERAGLGHEEYRGHNHGEDWGLAAVEMAVHSRKWGQGKFE
jgi:6,7-dimethyl-8-ribityllumazine synthase